MYFGNFCDFGSSTFVCFASRKLVAVWCFSCMFTTEFWRDVINAKNFPEAPTKKTYFCQFAFDIYKYRQPLVHSNDRTHNGPIWWLPLMPPQQETALLKSGSENTFVCDETRDIAYCTTTGCWSNVRCLTFSAGWKMEFVLLQNSIGGKALQVQVQAFNYPEKEPFNHLARDERHLAGCGAQRAFRKEFWQPK